MTQPFAGLRVIDATHVLAGPFAAYQLGVMGADVIRIDNPSDPDQSRLQGSDPNLNAMAMGTAFLAQGGNKRSVALNLKHSEGRDTLRRLIEGADVFVQNFRPGSLAALGLGYDDIATLNPRIIYCSISAFGQEGPRGGETGYDNVFQAMSGLMSMTGTPESGPLRAGAPVVDYATGYMAAFAIASALFRRAETGAGAHVDLAMMDAALMLMSAPIAALTAGGANPGPQGNRFPTACMGTYATQDGLLMLGASNHRQQRRLWLALGRPDMVKPDHAASVTDYEGEARALTDILKSRSADDWAIFFNGHRVPAGRVRTLQEALADPQLASRGVIQDAGRVPGSGQPFAAPVAPFLMTDGNPFLARPAPRLGEHTIEILTEAGLSPDDIAALLQDGTALQS